MSATAEMFDVCVRCDNGKRADKELHCDACLAEYGERSRRTRREQIATAVLPAFTALLGNIEIAAAMKRQCGDDERRLRIRIAQGTVAMADALIAELDK